jgi:hypothetical protein
MGAGVFHAGGQTDRQTDGQRDMTNQILAFRNFANAPKRGVNEVLGVTAK